MTGAFSFEKHIKSATISPTYGPRKGTEKQVSSS
jgi:hypothetical protein